MATVSQRLTCSGREKPRRKAWECTWQARNHGERSNADKSTIRYGRSASCTRIHDRLDARTVIHRVFPVWNARDKPALFDLSGGPDALKRADAIGANDPGLIYAGQQSTGIPTVRIPSDGLIAKFVVLFLRVNKILAFHRKTRLKSAFPDYAALFERQAETCTFCGRRDRYEFRLE